MNAKEKLSKKSINTINGLKNKIETKADIIYIEGVGYCKEITINRYNKLGINEPFNIYEPIEK